MEGESVLVSEGVCLKVTVRCRFDEREKLLFQSLSKRTTPRHFTDRFTMHCLNSRERIRFVLNTASATWRISRHRVSVGPLFGVCCVLLCQ
jgi:hypothetical protein